MKSDTKIERVLKNKLIITNEIEVKKEFLNLVKEFVFVISEEFGEDRLKLFYKNLKKFSFNIEDIDVTLMNKKKGGEVELKERKFKIKSLYSTFHELLHLATIYKKGSKEYCGFQVSNVYVNGYRGLAINEGYTQLLAERYFDKTNPSYPLEKTIAWYIEKLVGQEKMENLYFDCNFFGLMEILEKYIDDFALTMFNIDFDPISTYLSSSKNYNNEQMMNYLNKFILSTGDLLAKGFIKKLELGEIDEYKVITYIDNLSLPLRLPNIDFEFKFINDKEKYLNQFHSVKTYKK